MDYFLQRQSDWDFHSQAFEVIPIRLTVLYTPELHSSLSYTMYIRNNFQTQRILTKEVLRCWYEKVYFVKIFFSQGFHLFHIIFNRKCICLKMFLLFWLMVKYFEIRILSTSQKKFKKNLFKKLSDVQGSFLNFWQGILKSMKYFLIVSIDFSKCLIKSVNLLK